MIAVPTYAAAYMQQNLRQILHHTGNLVRDAFGGMIMSRVQAEQLLTARTRVTRDKPRARPDHKAFAADAEVISALDRVQIQLGGEMAFAKTASSDSISRARGAPSTVRRRVLVMPSGIDDIGHAKFLSSALPMAAPILRLAIGSASIQN